MRQQRYRYLPFLTFLLLLLLAGFAIRMHLQRPPEDIRRKMASFQLTLELIAEHYPHIDRDRLFEAAMGSIIENLDDPYSRYLSPQQLEDADIEAEGEFGGVGIQIAPANGKAIIIDLLPGGAAEEENISPGDHLVEADGKAVDELTFQELISTIRGRPGTTVSLTIVSHETGERTEMELERRLLEIAPVRSTVLLNRIGMIELRNFSARSIASLREILDQMREEDSADAILLDLRDNPGGLLEAAVQTADMFLESGIIVTLQHSAKGVPDQPFTASESTLIPPHVPMVVLVNERSASAAELLSGALQSNSRATVIGTATVGKGSVDTVFSLPDGSGLVLKVAGYLAGGEIGIESKGIEPDILVGERPPPLPDADRQEQLEWLEKYREAQSQQKERAVEFLENKLGISPPPE